MLVIYIYSNVQSKKTAQEMLGLLQRVADAAND